MEDCPVGILIDHSEPTETQSQLVSILSQEEDKENVHPLTDSIEIERSADTERRLSLTLKSSDDIQNRILRDVTEQSLPNSAKKCQSPALRLIDDETFDFDLAVSPAVEAEVVTNEEEDEIFFGPVCFTERLKGAAVKEEEVPPLSPLNAKQFALMVKEANYVAYRIKNSKTSSGSESSPGGSKTSCPSTDEEISPSIRKHTRSGTFTKCQSPLELLPEEIRKVLPVIGDSEKAASNTNDCQKTLLTSTEERHASEIVSTFKVDEKSNMNTVQSNVKRPSVGRLQQPSKFQGSKLSQPSSIKYAGSCESLDIRTSGHESDSNCSVASDSSDIVLSKNNLPKSQMTGKNTVAKISRLQVPVNKRRSFNASMNCSLNVSTNESSSKVNHNTSRLAIPKAGSHANSKGVTPKNGMQPKFLNNSVNLNKNNLTKSEDKKQKKSVEVPRRNSPRLKAKEAATVNDGTTKKGISGLKSPITTKLSLMKPGEIQKRNHKTITGNGPMKAVQSIDAINSTALIKKDKTTKMTTCVSTPVKQDKCVKPKLLANNFTAPSRSSSVSSTSTPVSSRRRSFLPTPNKSTQSVGSYPDSPLLRRTGSSTSSRQSLSSCGSISDTSVFNSSMTRPRIGSTQKSTRLYSTDVYEKSPSTMKMSKPNVVHTPQLPQKKVQSKWSPIRRTRPMNRDEEAMQCTKRKL